MDEHVGQVISLGKFEQAVKVSEQRMDADIAAQAHQMNFALVLLDEPDELQELLVLEERPVAYRVGQANGLLRHRPSGADVLVAYLTVAHRPIGQPDIFAVCMDQTMGIVGHQHVIGRRVGLPSGVVVVFAGVGVEPPAIAYDQNAGSFRNRGLFFRHGKNTFQSITTETRHSLVPVRTETRAIPYDTGRSPSCQTFPFRCKAVVLWDLGVLTSRGGLV